MREMQETLVQEMQVQSLGQEDPLEEEMATHFSILALKISWTEEPGGLQPTGSQSWIQLSTRAHKRDPKELPIPFRHVRTQLEDGTRKQAFTGKCSHLTLGFLASRTVRNKFLLLTSHLLWYFSTATWTEYDRNATLTDISHLCFLSLFSLSV